MQQCVLQAPELQPESSLHLDPAGKRVVVVAVVSVAVVTVVIVVAVSVLVVVTRFSQNSLAASSQWSQLAGTAS